MTIQQASAKLHLSEQAVRTLMRRGKLPIGICIRSEERWKYVVYEKWVDKYLAGEMVIIPEGMSDYE